MEIQSIFIEEQLQAEAEKVWRAITERDQMEQWYFRLQEFKPEVGFKFQFWGGPDDERQYLHLCEITEAVKNKKLSHSWKFDGYEGNTQVTFELVDRGTETTLKFSHTGLETFPASNPDFAAENFRVGWNAIISKSLKDYLQMKS